VQRRPMPHFDRRPRFLLMPDPAAFTVAANDPPGRFIQVLLAVAAAWCDQQPRVPGVIAPGSSLIASAQVGGPPSGYTPRELRPRPSGTQDGFTARTRLLNKS
jgi:hypothetical protein